MGMCIGKNRGKIARMALFGIIAIGSVMAATAAFAALDTPHNFIVNCDTCHPTTPPDYWWTSQGSYNGSNNNTLCGQCHYNGSPYKDAVEHITTSKYGNLDFTCSTCHHPHSQSQMRTWRNVAGAPNAFKYSGLTTSVTQTTLTKTGAGWGSTNQWAGFVLVPNVAYLNFNYKIKSNTDTVITIDGARNDKINLTYAGVNKTFGITYGREVKEAISGLPVKFFGKTGQNSFADGDATIDGVCQVCHTLAQSFNSPGTLEGPGHPSGKAGTDCTQCHIHQNSTGGFLPSCSTCHGSPPTETSIGGPNGLATPATGSTSVGKHQKHAANSPNLAYDCAVCHTAYDMSNRAVDIGFSIFSMTGGIYNGQAAVNYVGRNGSAAINGGAQTCSNIYCHSTVQGGANGTGAPTYKTPLWTAAATVQCGDCHKADGLQGDLSTMDTGSHTKHLNVGGVNCITCHTNYGTSTHVDGTINLTVSSTMSGVPQAGYGTCTTMCHNNGANNNPGATPQWGTTGNGCSTCHLTPPTTGSHTKHLSGLASGNFTSNATCGNCHANADAATNTAPTTHLNGMIDIYDASVGDLNYPTPKAKGSPYSTCTAAYCHSNGMSNYAAPNWGNTTTGCNFCHNAIPTSGAHAKHVKTSPASYGGLRVGTSSGNDFDCGNCHPAGVSNHMDGTLQISLASTDGGALKSKNNTAGVNLGMVRSPGTNVVCNAAYCHSSGQGSFVSSPDWYGGPYGGDACAECHGNYPNTGSHNAHVVGIHWDNVYTGSVGLSAAGNLASSSHGNSSSSTTISCNACHFQTVTVSYNDNGTTCSTASCHGAGGTAMGALNMASIAATNAHLNGAPNLTFAGGITPKSRAQVRDDITTVGSLDNNWTRPGSSYKIGATPYDTARFNLSAGNYIAAGKTCNDITCHNGYPATWGTTASCTTCHMELP